MIFLTLHSCPNSLQFPLPCAGGNAPTYSTKHSFKSVEMRLEGSKACQIRKNTHLDLTKSVWLWLVEHLISKISVKDFSQKLSNLFTIKFIQKCIHHRAFKSQNWTDADYFTTADIQIRPLFQPSKTLNWISPAILYQGQVWHIIRQIKCFFDHEQDTSFNQRSVSLWMCHLWMSLISLDTHWCMEMSLKGWKVCNIRIQVYRLT